MKNNKPLLWQHTILPIISLFTSLSTLICCALPALFVTFGMGAILSSLVSTAPWITFLSEYKVIIFKISAFLLVLGCFFQFKMRNAPCPADQQKQNLACC